ncbi:MAG: AbrB/MazE/SpoVT family DNA-binding domain-containing protein [Firmicutes bacterium]|nr:AbrB/MazE/SpoVT family DNA-binding domain-containing protein [Bacillota bacterium]
MRDKNQVAVRVDRKGRITLPKGIRKALEVEAGDTLFLKYEPEERQVRLARTVSSFDVLAEHALKQYRDGRTKTIEEFARECNIRL